MPRPEAERIAESMLRQLKPVIVGLLDVALAEPNAQGAGADATGAREDEDRYVRERVAVQLERYRGKPAKPRCKAEGKTPRRKPRRPG